MTALGIDLGGTKIEAQLFDAGWQLAGRRRVDTPKDYAALLAALADLIGWGRAEAGGHLPTGVSTAGRIDPRSGLALTANLPATGRPIADDLARAAGQRVTFVNDGCALTLSEAVFGAARGCGTVAGVILGTGIGGAVAVGGKLLAGPGGFGGEFGHFGLAAAPVVTHGLPLLRCGCGRMGCTETLIAGPGLTRLARHLTGRDLTPRAVAAARHADPSVAAVWAVWCDLVAEMLVTLTLTLDPDCIVLGGGLSQIDGLVPDLSDAARRAMIAGWAVPELRVAQGGDASGARGAAYAATQAGAG